MSQGKREVEREVVQLKLPVLLTGQPGCHGNPLRTILALDSLSVVMWCNSKKPRSGYWASMGGQRRNDCQLTRRINSLSKEIINALPTSCQILKMFRAILYQTYQHSAIPPVQALHSVSESKRLGKSYRKGNSQSSAFNLVCLECKAMLPSST